MQEIIVMFIDFQHSKLDKTDKNALKDGSWKKKNTNQSIDKTVKSRQLWMAEHWYALLKLLKL